MSLRSLILLAVVGLCLAFWIGWRLVTSTWWKLATLKWMIRVIIVVAIIYTFNELIKWHCCANWRF